MYWGVLSDTSYGEFGDYGILSQGIYRDDDGDPATEGSLIAWWDGLQYRWSIDGPVFDGVITPDEAFMPVDLADLQEWALSPLQEEPDFELYPETGFPPGPLYETGVMDDLGGLNIDYFVYLGRNYDAVTNPTFTIRMTAISVDNPDPYGDGTVTPGFPIPDGAYGNEIPAWVSNPAPPLATFLDTDADGVTDNLDNCILEPNGPIIPDAGGNIQRDTDGDNYGNVCDPDFNGDLVVNADDLAYLKQQFFTNDEDADLNGDGLVNAADLAITKVLFFGPPGPSGLAP
jgi:hypothetical protein